MRNPIPDLIITMLIVSVLFIIITRWQSTVDSLDYFDYQPNPETPKIG
tara:strand:+ start:720 stop:863 length:144 start_codon:yes stop_codon:yes gene_type:complete